MQTQDSEPGVLFAIVAPSPIHPQMPLRVSGSIWSPVSGFTPILSEVGSCSGPSPGLGEAVLEGNPRKVSNSCPRCPFEGSMELGNPQAHSNVPPVLY